MKFYEKFTVSTVLLLSSSTYLNGQEYDVSSQTQICGGYNYNISGDSEDIVDQALWGIYYLFSQQVVEEETKDIVHVTDTMLLAVGQHYSIYHNPEFLEHYRQWVNSNRARGKKVTNLVYLPPAPISERLDLLEHSSDYGESNIGDPVQIYKRKSDNTIISCLVYGDYLTTSQNIREFEKWEITTETSEVLGYKCTKALTRYGGRTYTAWFCPDIPISDGPWKFYGLPGLIMKVEDAEHIFSFEAIGIEKFDDAVIVLDSNLEKCKLKYFNKRAEYNRTNIDAMFLSGGSTYRVFLRPYLYFQMEK